MLLAYYNGVTPGDAAYADDFYAFRVRLNADAEFKDGYQSGHWNVLLDIDGDGYKEFTLDLAGGFSSNSVDRLFVYYNNLNQQTVNTATDKVAEFIAASTDLCTPNCPVQTYNHARVVPATGGSDPNKVWLDFQIPITALKNLSVVKQVYPSSLVRLFYSTSTSETDPLQKDWMLPTISFGDPLNPNVSATKTDSLFNDADGSGGYTAGDTILYTISITNNGNLDATGVTLSDTPGAYTSLVVGSVATMQGLVTSGNILGDITVGVIVGTVFRGGGTVTITFKVTIQVPLPQGVTQISNQGTVSGTNISTKPTNDPDTIALNDATISNLQEAELALSKDVNNPNPNVGDTITYTITVTNSGPSAATSIQITDLLPTGVTYQSFSASQGSYTSGTGIWLVGTLANVASATLTITATIDTGTVGTTITNTAEVTAVDQFDPDSTPNNNVTSEDDQVSADITVTPFAGVSLDPATKVDSLLDDADGNGEYSPGDTLLYTVTIWNEGTTDAMGVVFTDTPDPNTTLVVGSVTTTKGNVIIGSNPSDMWVEVNVGTLPAGGPASETVTISIHVMINDPLPPGVTNIYNQGVFISNETPPTPTDDPATNPDDDPTRTPLYFGGGVRGVPAFPNMYNAIAAALGAGVLAYMLRRRVLERKATEI